MIVYFLNNKSQAKISKYQFLKQMKSKKREKENKTKVTVLSNRESTVSFFGNSCKQILAVNNGSTKGSMSFFSWRTDRTASYQTVIFDVCDI